MERVKPTPSLLTVLLREFCQPFKHEAGAGTPPQRGEPRAVDAPCSGSKSSVMALLVLHSQHTHRSSDRAAGSRRRRTRSLSRRAGSASSVECSQSRPFHNQHSRCGRARWCSTACARACASNPVPEKWSQTAHHIVLSPERRRLCSRLTIRPDSESILEGRMADSALVNARSHLTK